MCANPRNKSQHVVSSAKLRTQTSNLRLDFSNVNVQNVSDLFESSFKFVSNVVVLFVDIPQEIFFLKKIVTESRNFCDYIISFLIHARLCVNSPTVSMCHEMHCSIKMRLGD